MEDSRAQVQGSERFRGFRGSGGSEVQGVQRFKSSALQEVEDRSGCDDVETSPSVGIGRACGLGAGSSQELEGLRK
jgi:hypothetical protein